MKPTSFLINTARGPIVSDAALYRALSEGWIAGAGLDDIEEEPAKRHNWKPVNPLFTLPNAVITPHAAYYSEEAIRTVRDFAAREVVRVLTGQQPISPVNAEELASRPRAGPSLNQGDRPARSQSAGRSPPVVSPAGRAARRRSRRSTAGS